MTHRTQTLWFRWLLSWINLFEGMIGIITFGKVVTMRFSMAWVVRWL